MHSGERFISWYWKPRISIDKPQNPVFMKKRIRKVANFLAFNLLFFALYLNFIHQDKQAVINIDRSNKPTSAAFGGTMLVEHPEKYINASLSSENAELPVEKASLVKRSIN